MSALLSEGLGAFLEVLGDAEEPMAMFYTDEEPPEGTAPKPGRLPTAEEEARGEVDFGSLWADFSCVIGQIWIARHKRTAAYFARDRFGCLGGAFYLGFNKPQLDVIAHYVSTGIPNVMEGELYFDSVEKARQFFRDMDPRPAPKRFCVFKPVSLLTEAEQPEVVVFFARPEQMCGLHQLVRFVSGDLEAVASPFGAGCSNIVTWPIKYMEQGKMRAVLGGWDPSERRYLKTDELTLAVPAEMYRRMLESWSGSFLTASAWQGVRKRIAKSRKAWGEET